MYRCTLLSLLLLLLIAGAARCKVALSEPPRHVTSLPGANVTQQCTPGGAPYSGFFEWRYYDDDERVGHQIYSFEPYTFNSAQFPAERYRRDGTYGLRIGRLDWTDGGQYSCNFLTDDQRFFVSIVVIEKPLADIKPAAVASVGQTVSLVCSAYFGGPLNTGNNYADGHFPQLEMIFNGQPIDVASNYTPGQLGDNPRKHLLTKTSSIVVTASDSMKQLDCRVSTAEPAFTVTTSNILYVQVAAHDVIITPDRTEYEVNDVIMCSAKGYPTPEITWVPISSPVVDVIHGPYLNVSDEMMDSENVWNCTAFNSLNTQKLTQQIRFNVFEDGTIPEEMSTGTMVGIGVGVAIGVALLLTAVIIIIAFVLKRRNKAEASKTPVAGGVNDVPSSTHIYHPVSPTNPEADYRPPQQHGKPVPKPRVASSSSTLEGAVPLLDMSTEKPPATRPSDRSKDSAGQSLDASVEKPPRNNLRKPRPAYKGSQESLDTSTSTAGYRQAPVPAERPQTSLRGSTESLDKLSSTQPAGRGGPPTGRGRPIPATRASNESLDRSLDSGDVKPHPANRPKVKQRSSADTSLDSAAFRIGDRSRDSTDQSVSGARPRPPGVAPKPLKHSSDNSTDV